MKTTSQQREHVETRDFFSRRPLPRHPVEKIRSSDPKAWESRVFKHSKITPHEFDVLGVLYSSVWMGRVCEAKTVKSDAFKMAGVGVSVVELQIMVNAKLISNQGDDRWKLTTYGSQAYDVLYYAEQDGVYPPKFRVPPTPDDVVDRHKGFTLGQIPPSRMSRVPTAEEARRESLAELETKVMAYLREVEVKVDDLRARQDTMAKMYGRLDAKLDTMAEMYGRLDAKLDSILERLSKV